MSRTAESVVFTDCPPRPAGAIDVDADIASGMLTWSVVSPLAALRLATTSVAGLLVVVNGLITQPVGARSTDNAP